VIFHLEKRQEFPLHHLAQLTLFLCGRNLQGAMSPTPALVSLAYLGIRILACGINKLKGAVLAILPACGYIRADVS
jgi:hypothetical protein